MDMTTNLSTTEQGEQSLGAEQTRIVELQELQLALVGGGIGDTQL